MTTAPKFCIYSNSHWQVTRSGWIETTAHYGRQEGIYQLKAADLFARLGDKHDLVRHMQTKGWVNMALLADAVLAALRLLPAGFTHGRTAAQVTQAFIDAARRECEGPQSA
ncbi:hypothetical protein LZ518_11730 [Sphingomonas sp. RB56-2]|uniref:Gene transfer agent family protein n=1 Tax=Sphingomonas brevis TaxID=2908206 RepID=A0ABT0SBP1_9SPHN|nr:hypothetical protein [Sphingomonas brevis]MCL6741797.1 hypothetical protein [Sphingomonas brevis]